MRAYSISCVLIGETPAHDVLSESRAHDAETLNAVTENLEAGGRTAHELAE